ncbi:hypothetical protein FBU30_007080 [Linnemannia zychae]|nr:hypothetical protein FBU30_007080 [Linnemannia zychae]
MGHLSLKIQTSALFLKAKHAFSIHRKSSHSSSALSPPPTPSDLNSSQLFSSSSTAITAPLTSSSSTSSTDNSLTATSDSTSSAGIAPPKKTKRSSRFKVKTFASFRDRSRSPPLLSSSTSSAGPITSGSQASSSSFLPTPTSQGSVDTKAPMATTITAVTASTCATTGSDSTSRPTSIKSPTSTPPSQSAPVFSVNPYSSSWSPSTVAILKSPLRTRSSSKINATLNLTQPSQYSPAPNLILQPSPAIDLAPTYATGARTSHMRPLLHCGVSDSSSMSDYHTPVIGPQGNECYFTLVISLYMHAADKSMLDKAMDV